MSYMDTIDKAYKKMKGNLTINPQLEIVSNEILTRYHNDINQWDGISSIVLDNLIESILEEDRLKSIADVQMGLIFKKNYLEYMRDVETRSKIAELFMIRKNNTNLSWRVIGDIERKEFIKGLDLFPFTDKKRPKILANRFYVTTFIEISTTIVDNKQLEKTAIKLGISDAKNISFEKLQYQVRSKVDDYLKDKGLIEKETPWFKAAIAWSILDGE